MYRLSLFCFFFSSRRRHTRCGRDWSSDVCSSDLSNINNSFLADPNQWKKKSAIPDYSSNGSYTDLEEFNNHLFVAYNDENYGTDTLFQIVNNTPIVFLDEIEINGLKSSKDNFLISLAGSVMNYDQSLNLQDNVYQYPNIGYPDPQNAVISNGDYFIADSQWGLIKARNAYQSERVRFEGPRYNTAYKTK